MKKIINNLIFNYKNYTYFPLILLKIICIKN